MKSSPRSRNKLTAGAALAAAMVYLLVGAGRLLSGQSQSVADQFKLPAELAKYKGWKTEVQSPTPVPLDLWTRCTTTTPDDWAQARIRYGPHNQRYIQVYANPIAAQSLGQGKSGPFQTGAVIAKEKILDLPEGTVAGVAFLIQRATPQFASTGGWEFAYYPRSGDSASTQGCSGCHQGAASTDYVFGHYPSSGDSLHPIQTHSK
jgi:hypothetical protein